MRAGVVRIVGLSKEVRANKLQYLRTLSDLCFSVRARPDLEGGGHEGGGGCPEMLTPRQLLDPPPSLRHTGHLSHAEAVRRRGGLSGDDVPGVLLPQAPHGRVSGACVSDIMRARVCGATPSECVCVCRDAADAPARHPGAIALETFRRHQGRLGQGARAS